MSIMYSIDKEKGITFVLWGGMVTAVEFLAHVRRLTSDANWPPLKRLHLTDMRNISADSSIDRATLEEAAELFGKQTKKIANMKAAIMAQNEFDKAATFERYVFRYIPSVIVFNDLHTACLWLGINPEEAEGTLLQLRNQALGETKA
jgi:hypothetical protein